MINLPFAKTLNHCSVSEHAWKRYRERLGDKRVGSRKAKNQSGHRIRREIRRTINGGAERTVQQKNGNIKIYTPDFIAVVYPSKPRSRVITIYPH